MDLDPTPTPPSLTSPPPGIIAHSTEGSLYPLCFHRRQWVIEGQGTVMFQVFQDSELEREGDELVQAQRMETGSYQLCPATRGRGGSGCGN